MAGHSKWANIKHRKGIADARKGLLFTKLARELTVAAREGGSGDPAANSHLRIVMDKARAANMPMENVERAIKKGLGDIGEVTHLEYAVYEGYGPGGAAVLVHALTDNRNRTASEVRAAFSRGGGSLGGAGSVGWLFDNKALVTVEGVEENVSDEVALAAIEAGADDFRVGGGVLEVTGPSAALEDIRAAIARQGARPSNAMLTMVPRTAVQLGHPAATQLLRLLDHLEDLDDVNQVFTNADVPQGLGGQLAADG